MPKILLADDSATMQKVVDLVLRDQGYEVVSVSTGQEAMEHIAGTPPDLVLAYIKLPGGDGYQISQQIKSNPATQNIPVILLAGAFDPVDPAMMAQVQATDSIVKPFQAEDLLAVIQKYLGAAPAATAAPAEEAVVFEGEQAADSFAGVGEPAPADSFADIGEPAVAAPVAPVVAESFADVAEPVMEAAPVMAEPVMEAAPVEAAPVMAEPVEAEPVVAEAAPVMEAEPVMAEPVMEAAPVTAAPVAGATSVDSSQLDAVVRQAVTDAIANLNIQEIVMQALQPQAKVVLEKLAYEVVPEFLDRILRTSITESLTTVNRELENIIWEIVPNLAEEILKKEMERIRQESQ